LGPPPCEPGSPGTRTWQSHLQSGRVAEWRILNGECRTPPATRIIANNLPCLCHRTNDKKDKWHKIFCQRPGAGNRKCCQSCAANTHTHRYSYALQARTHTHTHRQRVKKGRRICTMYALRRSFGGLAPKSSPKDPSLHPPPLECPALPFAPAVFVLI